jgi:hypothetical protein
MRITLAIVSLGALATTALAGGTYGSGLVVLDRTASGALSMTGNSTVRIPAQAVYVNSSSSSAVSTVGNATLDAPHLYVVGGTSFSGHSGCTGLVTRGTVPYADPLLGLVIPSSQGQTDLGSLSITGGTRTISAGYYSHGISISGNANVTLSPGVYIMGANFRLTSGSISGQGVTIVMLHGGLSIAGSSSMQLSPPSDGPMSNVVIVQPSANTTGMSLSGGSDVSISGTIYVPGATLTLTGNSSLEGQGPQMGDLVDANRVTITGTAMVKIGRPDAQPLVLPSVPLFD